MAGPIEEKIKSKLTEALDPVHLEVENESRMHSVPPGSETHFRVLVISQKFDGLSRVARSRRVHEILATELKEGVHALSLKTMTPQEWDTQGRDVPMISPACRGGSKKDS